MLGASREVLPVILGVVAIMIVVFLVILCLCRGRGCARRETIVSEAPMNSPKKGTSNLIPPVFYTEDMRDPLLQEDLREHVLRPKKYEQYDLT